MPDIVDPLLYDKEYYLRSNVGYEEFLKGLDKAPINPKFKDVLNECCFSSGKTLLDVGCGRGDLVFYAVRGGPH